MNVKILVVTHKSFDDSIVPSDGYQVIKVGNAISSAEAASKGWLTDDVGENIADQNAYYCELTAHYWAWKNLKDVDIVGIVHYRRFFVDYNGSKSFKDNILGKKRIVEAFEHKNAIMPFWQCKVGSGFMLDPKRPESNGGLWCIRQIISERHPDVLRSYDYVVSGSFYTSCNMSILRKADFDAYSEFLFDVLDEYDVRNHAKGDPRYLRAFGYFSEILLPAWVTYRFRESEICRFDVKNTEYSDMEPRTFLGRFRTCRPLLLLVRYLEFWRLRRK